jgi:hypothetical protein
VEDQVFCVLHLHKWIIEKVITLLFTRSVDELASEEKTKRVKHIVVLQSYINTIALGSVTKPGHWKCPVKNQQEVGDCSFTDGQAKKVEQQLPGIIAKALVLEGSKADDWVNVITKLEWILTTFRQREDFTNAQIDTMTLKIDKWTVSWIALNGEEGMTNYTHCLTAGHVVYYLKYWRFFTDIAIKDGSILIRNTDMCIAIEHSVVGHPEHITRRVLKRSPSGFGFCAGYIG